MKTTEFLQVLKKLDDRLEIVPNKNRTAEGQKKFNQGLSNIMLGGQDICPIPSEEIREKFDPNYYYVFPNGMMAPFISSEDALIRVNKILVLISTPEREAKFFEKDE